MTESSLHADRRMRRQELVFQMSSEPRRRAAIDAVTGNGLVAFPVERFATGETFLLVLVVGSQHLNRAVAAVLAIDPHARQPQSG